VSEERYNEFLAEHDPKKGTMAHTWFVDGSSDASTLVERCEKTFKGKGPRFTTTTNPGSLSSVNLLLNGIGIDQAKALASILKGHPTLKSLCGNKGDETELDMSGKINGAGDIIMLAPEITDNGAMTSLDISMNSLTTGAVPGYDSDGNEEYATDMTGALELLYCIADRRCMVCRC
jgi:hypothetical protein